MSEPYSIFISYSHKDEWLKDELEVALNTLKRSGKAIVWTDRKIIAGSELNEEIEKQLRAAHVMLLLVSNNFIGSDYCMNVEFELAIELRGQGKLEIVPIIGRDCDWNLPILRKFNATPKDGVAVNPVGARKEDDELRDRAWKEVASAIRDVIDHLDAKRAPVEIKPAHVTRRVEHLQYNHNKVPNADIDDFYFEPEITYVAEEETITGTAGFCQSALDNKVIILSGDDQSGKSTVFLAAQRNFCRRSIPAVIISGRDIRKKKIDDLIQRETALQLEADRFRPGEIVVLIDDFDDCQLPEKVRREVLEHVCGEYRSVAISAFAPLQSYLFIESSMPEPKTLTLGALPPKRVYELVEAWVCLGEGDDAPERLSKQVHHTFQMIFSIVKDGSVPCYPGFVLSLLRVVDSVSGSDVALTSNAACYDALVTMSLLEGGVPNARIELMKNFLGFVAFRAWDNPRSSVISADMVSQVIAHMESELFVNLNGVKEHAVKSKLLRVTEEGYEFSSRFMLYFFAGRHLAKHVKETDRELYQLCVQECISHISIRNYANTLLYCLYFSNDVTVLSSLIDEMNKQFSLAQKWKLNKSADNLMRFDTQLVELSQSAKDHRDERLELLSKPYQTVVEENGALAERYLIPFSDVAIDMKTSDQPVDDDSYMGEMNSLFRLQSILGTALNTRSGTFGRDIILKTVRSMVEASGRFAHVNMYVSSQILSDPSRAVAEIERGLAAVPQAQSKSEGQFDSDKRKMEAQIDERLSKVVHFFTRWTVIVSQGVLGRLLADPGTVRALEVLHKQDELATNGRANEDGDYNFACALGIAQLWESGKIDTKFFDQLIERYGENCKMYDVLRFNLFTFSRYMPIELGERQWLDQKMKIKIRSTRFRQRDTIRRIGTPE